MAIVYQHRRLDNNEIFYIGIELDSNKRIATGLRSKNIYSRSKFWKNIISKTNYSIEILVNDVDNSTAKQIETYLIKYYGRKDLNLGNLVNLTDGGDGAIGCIQSKESRLKKSEYMKNRFISQETKLKLSIANKGKSINAKKVIDISTNNIYNSIDEVVSLSGIKRTTLKRWLHNSNLNKSNYRFYNEN